MYPLKRLLLNDFHSATQIPRHAFPMTTNINIRFAVTAYALHLGGFGRPALSGDL